MPKTSDAQLRATAKYNKAQTKAYAIRLNYKSDLEIIRKLDSVDNKQAYIKSLIREDLKNSR